MLVLLSILISCALLQVIEQSGTWRLWKSYRQDAIRFTATTLILAVPMPLLPLILAAVHYAMAKDGLGRGRESEESHGLRRVWAFSSVWLAPVAAFAGGCAYMLIDLGLLWSWGSRPIGAALIATAIVTAICMGGSVICCSLWAACLFRGAISFFPGRRRLAAWFALGNPLWYVTGITVIGLADLLLHEVLPWMRLMHVLE